MPQSKEPSNDKPTAREGAKPGRKRQQSQQQARSARRDAQAAAKTPEGGQKAQPEPAQQPEAATSAKQPETEKPAPQPSAAQPVAAAAPSAKGGRGAMAVGVLALLVACGLGGAGYWAWQQIDMRLAQQQSSQQQSAQELQAFNQTLNQSLERQGQQGTVLQQTVQQQLADALAQVEQDRLEMAERAEALAEQVSTLQGKLLEISGRRPSDWLLAEANHLVRLAGRKMWLEEDIDTSLALLASADERIRELNDPSLLPLRKSLAADIATLRALPALDLEGQVLRLSGLQDQVSQLTPLSVELPEAEGEPADLALSESVADWQQNLKKVWRQLSDDFITVQRRTGPVAPMLSPKQRWYLQENVRNKLVQAQQAVLTGQQPLYDSALANAHAWIGEFFQDDSVRQYLLGEIETLQQVTIEREYPQELVSRKQLEDLMRERVQALIQSKVGGA